MDRHLPGVEEARALEVSSPGASVLGGVVVDDEALWMAWEGARRAWLAAKERKSGSANTVDAYKIAFRQFFEWCALPPWQVSSAVAQGWAEHLAATVATATVNLKLSALSSFYRYVQEDYEFQTPDGRDVLLWSSDRKSPFRMERTKVSAYERAVFPTTEEAHAIMAEINTNCLTGKRDFALLYTLLVTCKRASEILNLRWGDLRELDEGGYMFVFKYKGKGRRKGVLPRSCYAAICAYLKADGRPPEGMEAEDYIFVAMDPERVRRFPGRENDEVVFNRPISKGQANRTLKKYARRAGVDEEKAHIHGLRHAGARLRVKKMKENGGKVDYVTIMELLGHSSLAVTQIYVANALEDPEDPGGDAAAEAWLPKGDRRRRRGEEKPKQAKLF